LHLVSSLSLSFLLSPDVFHIKIKYIHSSNFVKVVDVLDECIYFILIWYPHMYVH